MHFDPVVIPEGEIVKMQLTSNCICYGPEPKPEDEVEQHITLTRNHIWVTRYKYGKGFGCFERLDYGHGLIWEENGLAILKELGDYFASGAECEFVTDVGNWELKLINSEKKVFTYSGSLIASGNHGLKEICDDIRMRLDMPCLMLFDGGPDEDDIGEIVEDNHTEPPLKKDGDYILLVVQFNDSFGSYYYLCEDDKVEIGDQVIVPVGEDGTERIVEVINKYYVSLDKLPMPLEKLKTVIEKFVAPEEQEDGKRYVYCPAQNKEITTDDCFVYSWDEETTVCVEQEICMKCRYHF